MINRRSLIECGDRRPSHRSRSRQLPTRGHPDVPSLHLRGLMPRRYNLFDLLPSEILSHIFFLGVQEDRRAIVLHESYAHVVSRTFVATVGSVCKRWYLCALETPMLWQYVIIRGARTLRSNQLWINRSKATPLDIHIISSHFIPINFHSMDLILSLIIPQASRWREIHLHVDLVQSAAHFISRIPSSLRMLQVLSVHSNEWDVDWPLSRPPPKLPSSMPSLTRLRLSGVPVDWETFPVPNTITDLELALHPVGVQPYFSQFVRILSSCRLHIQRLVLDNSAPFGVQPASHPSVPEDQRLRMIFPSLNTLKLTNLRSAQLSRLIYLIEAPALHSLQLVDMLDDDFTLPLYQLGTGFSGATNIQPHTTFSSRGAYPTVSDLKLGVIELPPSPAALTAFQSLLHGMPSITRLSINFTEFKPIPAFLDVLIGVRSTSSFSPPSASQSCRPGFNSESIRQWLPRVVSMRLVGLSPSQVYRLATARRLAGLEIEHLEIDRRLVHRHFGPASFDDPPMWGFPIAGRVDPETQLRRVVRNLELVDRSSDEESSSSNDTESDGDDAPFS